MRRWLITWTAGLVFFTVGAYLGTNAVFHRDVDRASYAMLPLPDGGPGTLVCQRATRALLRAADGSSATASVEQKVAWDQAADGVLEACAAN